MTTWEDRAAEATARVREKNLDSAARTMARALFDSAETYGQLTGHDVFGMMEELRNEQIADEHHCDGRRVQLVPFAFIERPEGRWPCFVVERCDVCTVFDDDLDAARAEADDHLQYRGWGWYDGPERADGGCAYVIAEAE